MVTKVNRIGRNYFLVNAYINGFIGIALIFTGIILALIYGKLLLILSLIGILAFLNAWYKWRRSHNPSMKDIAI